MKVREDDHASLLFGSEGDTPLRKVRTNVKAGGEIGTPG
jgi:hypothetical protein